MRDGASVKEGPFLPVGMRIHCQITLNSSHIFISDTLNSRNTYLLDWEDNTWHQVESPLNLYTGGPCGLVTSQSGGKEVVAVSDGVSEIFSVDTLSWRQGVILKVRST